MRVLSAPDNRLARARPPRRPNACAISRAFILQTILSAKHIGKNDRPRAARCPVTINASALPPLEGGVLRPALGADGIEKQPARDGDPARDVTVRMRSAGRQGPHDAAMSSASARWPERVGTMSLAPIRLSVLR